jgi:hypothetical protein
MLRKLAWWYTAGFLGIFVSCHTPGLTDDAGRFEALRAADANLLNASVRIVHRGENFLSYAPADDMVAIVLYLSQTTTRRGHDQMAAVTRTPEQLERSYPEVRAFFAAKRQFDPTELFTNTFYERFGHLR